MIYRFGDCILDEERYELCRAGLRMVQTLQNRQITSAATPLTVRLGIHTGSVVVGEMGGGRHDPLAVGETLAIAARLKALAEPGMVSISGTAARALFTPLYG